jgi:hypothetical protein
MSIKIFKISCLGCSIMAKEVLVCSMPNIAGRHFCCVSFKTSWQEWRHLFLKVGKQLTKKQEEELNVKQGTLWEMFLQRTGVANWSLVLSKEEKT